MAFSARALRDAFGCFATGITVVSTRSPSGELLGVTVNSFSSVSLEPPLLLFSLGREASRFDDFVQAGCFTINVLRDCHQQISAHFATKGVASWDGIAHVAGELGCPILEDALAAFECRTEAVHDGGDHAILVGRVVAFRMDREGDPLLYYRGRYGSLGAP